jgi:hypothetical protein
MILGVVVFEGIVMTCPICNPSSSKNGLALFNSSAETPYSFESVKVSLQSLREIATSAYFTLCT